MAKHARITSGRRLELPASFRTFRRDTIEELIEQLIAQLDQIDGDTDLEPDVDSEDSGDLEPSIGTDGGMFGTDLELDDSDREPSLGWIERAFPICPIKLRKFA